ncbi:MAG: terminase, partial [Euryarchaeota archaeon]|nr:terminase [Euryarchaeota archaeon]
MKVFVAGRRSGKSFLSVAFLIREALAGDNRLVFYVAPTIGQARAVAWGLMKEWLPSWYTKSWNETRLTVVLGNGSQISLRSADNPDAMRGVGLDALVMDEIADMRPEVWYEVLRPACSDRQARVMFVGTPKGLSSWAFDIYKRARDETDTEWTSFTCTTAEAGFVPEDELESAQKDLDPRVYRQEYEASFESPSGVVYPFFDE